MTRATTDLLTIAEVQSLLKVSRATVYQLIKARGLPVPLKIGRCNRWPKSEIEGWIVAQPRAHVQVREEDAAMR